MKILPSLLLMSVLAPAIAQAVVLSFPDQATLDSEFPTATRYTVGPSSTVTVTTSSRVQLHAQGDATTAGREVIYSVADNTNYNFINSAKTFSYSNLSVSYLTSVGATYYAYVGVFSQNAGAVTTANDGVYFSIHGNGNDFSLMQRVDGVTTTLNTWTLTSAEFFPTVSLSSLSLTLTGTTWSVNGTLADSVNLTGSGSLTTPLTTTNWGSNFYLGLEADQTSTSGPTRFTELTVGDITVVPEPTSVTLVASSILFASLLGRMRRRICS